MLIVTSATTVTTVMPSTSHEAVEDVQVVEEAEVEEEEEYDTDSDAEYPIAYNLRGRFFRRFVVSSGSYKAKWTNGQSGPSRVI